MPKQDMSTPLKRLEQLIVRSFPEIEAWMEEQYRAAPPPFYCSTDLRNSGYKLAPIDTNLFPGGFNNLSPASYPMAVNAVLRQLDTLCAKNKSLLLIPENHTRNQPYLDNVAVLLRLLEMAGIDVRLGRLDGQTLTLTASDGTPLPMRPVERTDDRLHCGDFFPCGVLLNNDLSASFPPILADLKIPVLPPAELGWASRQKSGHFYKYARIAEAFANLLDVDPWLFSANFSVCPKVDFMRREGMECLEAAVAETLDQIKEKYRQHEVDDEPFVIIKADVGTYGMGVITVSKPEEVFSLNRKQRKAMSVGKEGAPIRIALIQEGVRTADVFHGAVAEPVVYMLGGTVAGGFYRVNTKRGSDDNLNSSGMSFVPLPFPPHPLGQADAEHDEATARLYVYGVIARLANLAAAAEMKALHSTTM